MKTIANKVMYIKADDKKFDKKIVDAVNNFVWAKGIIVGCVQCAYKEEKIDCKECNNTNTVTAGFKHTFEIEPNITFLEADVVIFEVEPILHQTALIYMSALAGAYVADEKAEGWLTIPDLIFIHTDEYKSDTIATIESLDRLISETILTKGEKEPLFYNVDSRFKLKRVLQMICEK